MATIWTKKTPGIPWKDAETGDYLIIAELTPSMAQGSIPGTDIEFHEQIALQNAQDNFYEYYAANLVAVGQGEPSKMVPGSSLVATCHSFQKPAG